MPKVAKALGALTVSRIQTAGLHAVGTVPGLCLSVASTGARSWMLRIIVGTKRREIGLGGYPAVTLAGAIEKARVLRDEVRERGVDPVERRRAAASALRAEQAGSLTFKHCATAYIKAQAPGWKNAKHAQQWTNTLAQHAYPVIGELSVRHVGKEHVLAILEPIWTSTTETATRLRGRIESVLDWATARGYREGENPARWRGHLDKILPPPRKVTKVAHHAAIPVADVGAFMQKLRQQEGMGARALEFAILTAARSGEVRGAVRAEFDMDAAVWTIPADRMKAGRTHRVPLSDRVLELLHALPVFAETELMFPAPRLGPHSDMTLTAVMRRMQVPFTVHGFRSTFRDWAAERTNYPREVAEMALAHAIGDKVEAAYRRGDLFEKRRQMMNDWAAFLAQPEQPAKVVNLRSKRVRDVA